MGDTRNARNVTVQGVGSPVPATDRGVQAGPGSSSTCDRSAPRVDLLALLAQNSPRAHDLQLAREEEEAALYNCTKIIKAMKAAVGKQKNISMTVKTGLADLEEAFDAMKHHRSATLSLLCQEMGQDSQGTPGQGKRKKRAANSPLEKQEEKRLKEVPGTGEKTEPPMKEREERRQKGAEESTSSTPVDDGFQKVLSRKEKKKAKAKKKHKKKDGEKSKKKPRTEAILITPAAGSSYAEVLRQLKSTVSPTDSGAVVASLRKTRTGDVLVELGPGTRSKADFGTALRSTLGATATVRCIEPRATVEIRDLDELTTEEEVLNAVKSALASTEVEVKIVVSGANSRGQKIATATLAERDSEKLLALGHLRIGWVSCRVRAKLVVPRCFKCLGFGHIAGTCTGPDRSRACFKCGCEEHKARSCGAPPSCFLCAANGEISERPDHVPGSSRCGAYKLALERVRKFRNR